MNLQIQGSDDEGLGQGVAAARSRHVTERLFAVWAGLTVVSVVVTGIFLNGLPLRWRVVWGLTLVVAGLWLEPLRVACRPERLKKHGVWTASPRRYDRRTLRVLPALVPVVLVGMLVILELGYGVFAPAGRRAAPEGLRFLIAGAALVSVPGAFLLSQWARARFRREVAALGDCFGCGYPLRGIASGVCPECGRPA